MSRLKLSLLFFILSNMGLATLPTVALNRSNFYLPNEDFCAVYQGSINSEHQFILSVKQESELTIQADNHLKVAVLLQGKTIMPYQIESSETPTSHQWFYHTKLQEKYTISVKGHTSNANIRLCLR